MIIGVPTIVGGKDKYKVIVTAHTGATVTVSKDGTTYTTPEESGTWTFEVPEVGTYTASATYNNSTTTKTVVVDDTEVELYYVSYTLSENSPAIIQKVAQEGIGDTYWDIGDVTEEIAFQSVWVYASGLANGHGLDMTGLTCRAFIIGFNHNSSIEGTGIHFQIGKTANGTDICYNATNGSFCMNSSSTNVGSWDESLMRNQICPSFYNALPAQWQAVIAPCTKVTGAGNTDDYNSYTTEDYIWLLSRYEVAGTGNSVSGKQAQYQYYSNGNSKVKYKHDDTTTANTWWLRSPFSSSSNQFDDINAYGNVSYGQSSNNYGFAPCFMVA